MLALWLPGEAAIALATGAGYKDRAPRSDKTQGWKRAVIGPGRHLLRGARGRDIELDVAGKNTNP